MARHHRQVRRACAGAVVDGPPKPAVSDRGVCVVSHLRDTGQPERRAGVVDAAGELTTLLTDDLRNELYRQ
jgi:hypothetical protein